jgi:hypothetical protein
MRTALALEIALLLAVIAVVGFLFVAAASAGPGGTCGGG